MSGRAVYLRTLLRRLMAMKSSDPRDDLECDKIRRELTRALRGNGEAFLDELVPYWFAANYRALLKEFPLPPGVTVERSAADRIEDRRVLDRLRMELTRAWAEGRSVGRAEGRALGRVEMAAKGRLRKSTL
jgi:hypothetical protein